MGWGVFVFVGKIESFFVELILGEVLEEVGVLIDIGVGEGFL